MPMLALSAEGEDLLGRLALLRLEFSWPPGGSGDGPEAGEEGAGVAGQSGLALAPSHASAALRAANTWRGQLGAWLHANAPDAFAALWGQPSRSAPAALGAAMPSGAADPIRTPAWCLAALGGSTPRWRITLMDHGVPHAPAVLAACEALGAVAVPAATTSPAAFSEAASTATTATTALAVFQSAIEPDHPAALRVDLLTPLQLQHRGQVLRDAPSLELLLRGTVDRLAPWLPPGRTGDTPDAGWRGHALMDPATARHALDTARAAPLCQHDLQRVQVRRRSARTAQVMPLHGLVGTLHYGAPAAALAPWLRLAQWLQLGSRTRFGLGALAAAPHPA